MALSRRAARWKARGGPFRLVLFEGGDHGLSEHREERDRLVRYWFDHYLRDNQRVRDRRINFVMPAPSSKAQPPFAVRSAVPSGSARV